MPIERAFDEYLEYCEFTRRMSRQTLSAKRWVMRDFRTSVPASSLSDITTQQVNDWIAAQARRGLNSRTINTRICHVVAMFRYFRDMGVEMPELKIRHIVKQKETEPIRRVFYTREQIEQVLGYCNQIQWLLVKLSFDCGLRITELRNLRLMNISDRMIVFVGKGGKRREVHMSREAERNIAQRRGAAAFNASAVLLGGFSQFSPTLAQTFVRDGHSTQWGDAHGIAGDARPFKRSNYATIFARTRWPDGGMF